MSQHDQLSSPEPGVSVGTSTDDIAYCVDQCYTLKPDYNSEHSKAYGNESLPTDHSDQPEEDLRSQHYIMNNKDRVRLLRLHHS